MREFSRWMPPATKHENTFAGLLVLVGFLGAAVAAAVAWPIPLGLAIGVVVALATIGTEVTHERLRQLAAQRRGEDIGTFVRAFDRRSMPFDPWVLRASWDALQSYLQFSGGHVPLRANDGLFREPLWIDPDDADDILEEIAQRAGHSLERTAANPFYGHIDSVGDLVMFVTLQPRLSTEEVQGTQPE